MSWQCNMADAEVTALRIMICEITNLKASAETMQRHKIKCQYFLAGFLISWTPQEMGFFSLLVSFRNEVFLSVSHSINTINLYCVGLTTELPKLDRKIHSTMFISHCCIDILTPKIITFSNDFFGGMKHFCIIKYMINLLFILLL